MDEQPGETNVVIRDGAFVTINEEARQALFKATQDAVKAIILIQATAPDDEEEESDMIILQLTRILRKKLDKIKLNQGAGLGINITDSQIDCRWNENGRCYSPSPLPCQYKCDERCHRPGRTEGNHE